MGSRLFFKLKQLWRTLWVRATIISLFGFIAAALSPLVAPILPTDLLIKINEETVRSLLDILTNSMLTVTTFSLTIMVTTHLTAAQQVTPRVHRLLRSDTRTQTVIATFIGSFVFALTSTVIIQMDFVAEAGFAVLYVATLLVMGLVIVAILRWVGHLSALGSLEDSTGKVQDEAERALKLRFDAPYLGGEPPTTIGENAHSVAATKKGFVQHIDTGELSEIVNAIPGRFHVQQVPGDFVRIGDPLGALDAETLDQETEKALRSCFTLGESRTFSQDAIFGVSVMTEIAERALSPAVNDPRTALDLIVRLTDVLEHLPEEVRASPPKAPGVHVPKLNIAAAIENSFSPIARDGSTFFEVQNHIQAGLSRLALSANSDIAEAARIASAHALAYAEDGLLLEADRARVRELAVARKASSV